MIFQDIQWSNTLRGDKTRVDNHNRRYLSNNNVAILITMEVVPKIERIFPIFFLHLIRYFIFPVAEVKIGIPQYTLVHCFPVNVCVSYSKDHGLKLSGKKQFLCKQHAWVWRIDCPMSTITLYKNHTSIKNIRYRCANSKVNRWRCANSKVNNFF